ncbi:MAG: glycosyltransferase family 1 protein [Alphaproteobacteria bacterium]|nr:glycosyltransferase family 1 protein [Alphaproteobacteria bacterium]
MKLIVITDAWHPQINGVVRTYEHIGEELEKRGHEVKIIGPRDMPRRIPLPGYREIELAIAPYKTIEKIINEMRPDEIHIATEGPMGWAARRYCRKHGRGFSSSYHTHFPDYIAKRAARLFKPLYKPVQTIARKGMRRFHAPAKLIMVATQSLADELRQWGFQNRFVFLTRGINLSLFSPTPQESESNPLDGIPGPIALYVGRIAIEKNIEDMLDMDWPGSKVLIGSGPALETLKRKYPRAHFLGPKTGQELAACYRAADVFTFPSRTDTFGIVLIEALASGLPVAAYNVTGPKDIITEDFMGVLCEENIGQAAQKALQIEAKEKRAQHAHKNYTWEKAADQFEEAILRPPKKLKNQDG